MPALRYWALLVVGLVLSSTPAIAQLGSVANPPPQNLFHFNQQPKLDPGLGTYAERRARLLRDRNGIVPRTARPARRRHRVPH